MGDFNSLLRGRIFGISQNIFNPYVTTCSGFWFYLIHPNSDETFLKHSSSYKWRSFAEKNKNTQTPPSFRFEAFPSKPRFRTHRQTNQNCSVFVGRGLQPIWFCGVKSLVVKVVQHDANWNRGPRLLIEAPVCKTFNMTIWVAAFILAAQPIGPGQIETRTRGDGFSTWRHSAIRFGGVPFWGWTIEEALGILSRRYMTNYIEVVSYSCWDFYDHFVEQIGPESVSIRAWGPNSTPGI